MNFPHTKNLLIACVAGALLHSACTSTRAHAPILQSDDASLTSRPAREAQAAYALAVSAYEKRDFVTFKAAFLDSACGPHGSLLHPDQLEHMPWNAHAGIRSDAVEVLRSSTDEAVLATFGLWYNLSPEHVQPTRRYLEASDDTVAQGAHERIVVMRNLSGRWMIASDTPIEDPSCGTREFARPQRPQKFIECTAKHEADLRECDLDCSGNSPGHACFTCPELALCSVAKCLGLTTIEEVCLAPE